MVVKPIFWQEDCVMILDQRLLPWKVKYLRCSKVEQVARAIKGMAIRGAPAIGIAAAMGVVLGMQSLKSKRCLERRFNKCCQVIAASRPTARNLFWALEQMQRRFQEVKDRPLEEIKNLLKQASQQILESDIAINQQIGRHGQHLIKSGMRVLTHCNAGALATGGYGTALGVIRAAWEAGTRFEVLADETRPYLQGARLTAWELKAEGIPVKVITDNTAGYLMANGQVDLVIVGADRIAANGDTANKIGTYSLAVLAQHHQIPFYVAAPSSTFDLNLPDGKAIPIETRSDKEVIYFGRKRICPEGVSGLYYAFDVTPAGLITGIITEKGILNPPLSQSIEQILGG